MQAALTCCHCSVLPLQEAAQHRASTDAALRSAGAEAELQQSIDRDLADTVAELAIVTNRGDDLGSHRTVKHSGDAGETITELSVRPNHHCPTRAHPGQLHLQELAC